MTVLAQDTFTRANQVNWGTASDSETWTTSGVGSTQSIASNKGVIAATGGGDVHNKLGTQSVGDQDVQCKVVVNSVNDVAGVQARFSAASGSSSYKLAYYGNDLHLNKAFNGNNTVLQQYGGYNLTPGVAYQFRIRCVGSTIQAMLWPDVGTMPANWMLSATDFSIASGGFAVLAASGDGSGVQFSQFIVNDIALSDEMSIALAWLKSTLAGDGVLSGYAPGGVSRTFAQPGVATPYVVMQYQSGTDYPVFGGARAYSDLYFEIMAVGPAKNTQSIVNAASRINTLLTVTQSTAVTGGTIAASFRTQPMESDPLVDGEQWTSIGGMYRIMAKAS